jgi:predicted amidohydrolase YtcJ
MNQKTLGIIFLIVAVASFYCFVTMTPREANLLLINGIVYTLDEKNTIAEAIAIRGNRIVSVGSTSDLKEQYPQALTIDLQGKTVMPGFVDAHGHVLGEGSRLATLDVVGTTSAEQIVQMVAQRVQQSQPGQWIYGRGWDQNDWEVKEFPTHDILDAVSPNNPVILRRIDGHALWVNKKALELADITAATKDPDGGKIHRDNRGNPTGVLIDNAMDLIDKVVPELTDEEIEQRIKLALEECAKLGLTEVHDMGVDMQVIKIYKKLIDNGECPLRIYAAISGTGETWEQYRKSGPEIGYKGLLTVRALKLYMDGALGSRGAALLEEYSDDPGNRGLTITSEAEISKACEQALESGFQVCTHAIGDRGNHITLNEYEKVLRTLPKGSPSPRWRIEHAQVLQLSDIPRFHELGILPSMQPTHCTSDMYWAEARLGPERIKGAYAWRSLLQTGSIILSGSDFPVESVNPLWGFYAAITRSDHTGYPQEGWRAQQKMTREEAARSFTHWAAYGAFEENYKGTIEVGKWADLTIFGRNIMELPPKDILFTDVAMTIVDGKVVYEKPIAQ